MAKEGIVHVKNNVNIIQHLALAFYRKYSDAAPFVIVTLSYVTVI